MVVVNWSSHKGDRMTRSLLNMLALCPRQGAPWECKQESAHSRVGIPGHPGFLLWCNKGSGLTPSPLRFQPSWTPWCVKKTNKNKCTTLPQTDILKLLCRQDSLSRTLSHYESKSRFPQLISFNGWESPQAKAQPPCVPPEAVQPGLFTWACMAKSGKKIQSQTYNASPKSLKKPQAQSAGFWRDQVEGNHI